MTIYTGVIFYAISKQGFEKYFSNLNKKSEF